VSPAHKRLSGVVSPANKRLPGAGTCLDKHMTMESHAQHSSATGVVAMGSVLRDLPDIAQRARYDGGQAGSGVMYWLNT
jgi:hypothetical protein